MPRPAPCVGPHPSVSFRCLPRWWSGAPGAGSLRTVVKGAPMAIWSPPRPSTSGSGGLDRYFHVTERGSTTRTEVIAGAATWLTMAYIIFVNPAIIGSIPDHLGNFVSGGKAFEAAKVAAGASLGGGGVLLFVGGES